MNSSFTKKKKTCRSKPQKNPVYFATKEAEGGTET